MFSKILIANRAEIACRIISTARRLGIHTVAVYSEADANALHVQNAEEAICIGASPSQQSYLNSDAIINACRQSGAEAVHPGYGFLSENAEFAEALVAVGICFIGPPPAAIRAMGDKIASKQLAMAAGVNTIPGSDEAVADADEAVRVASEIGYPVMLKASAGGGGKGMRIATGEKECREGFERATSEAHSAFGDGRLLIEKYINEPRHIEVQILADAHGNIVHLGERECSIQRRHQKVMEEAPSPFLDKNTREAIGAQAVALAKAVDYQSAGTVEFVMDNARNFYFLEMNTRLQVEHPVTEMITGLDLVEQMIRIAGGEVLDFKQEQVRHNGWAMEARIYAEDASRKFLPGTGRLNRYVSPLQNVKLLDESLDNLRDGLPDDAIDNLHGDASDDARDDMRSDALGNVPPDLHASLGSALRLDSGVQEGDEVSIHYDPLLAKLIAHGDNRAQALARLGAALDIFIIEGVAHNIPFLRALTRHPLVISGALSTTLIAEEFGGEYDAYRAKHPQHIFMIIAATVMQQIVHMRAQYCTEQVLASVDNLETHWVAFGDGNRWDVQINNDDAGHDVQNDAGADENNDNDVATKKYTIQIAAQTFTVHTTWRIAAPLFVACINGTAVYMQVQRAALRYRILYEGCASELLLLPKHAADYQRYMPTAIATDTSRFLLSPMPGLLLRLSVVDGQQVKSGDELAVVEAMKMENVLRAPRDVVICKVLVAPGDTVAVDQPLVEFAE